MRCVVCFFLVGGVTLVAAPALASGGGGHGGEGSHAAKGKEDSKSKKKEAVSITGGQGPDDPIFLHLAPLTLPIINDYGAQQLVTMLIDLQMKALEPAQKMQKEMPRLKDAVLQALYGGLADGSMCNAQALDIPKIKTAIHDTINRVFGGDYVQEVLIQGVAQRKL